MVVFQNSCEWLLSCCVEAYTYIHFFKRCQMFKTNFIAIWNNGAFRKRWIFVGWKGFLNILEAVPNGRSLCHKRLLYNNVHCLLVRCFDSKSFSYLPFLLLFFIPFFWLINELKEKLPYKWITIFSTTLHWLCHKIL
jgi:hypothetical protein